MAPKREGDPRAGAGVEADEEVALNPNDPEPDPFTMRCVLLERLPRYRRTGKIAQCARFPKPYEPGRLHPPETGRFRLSGAGYRP